MKVFFNDGYAAPGHGADATRKSGEIAAALATGRVPAVDLHLDAVTAFGTTNSDRLSQVVPNLRAQAANAFLAHNGNARNNHITRKEPRT